jgi:DNA-directed RNA polymerase alpha subunit
MEANVLVITISVEQLRTLIQECVNNALNPDTIKESSLFKMQGIKLSDCDLSIRCIKILSSKNINTVGELMKYINDSPTFRGYDDHRKLLRLRNMGHKSIDEIGDFIKKNLHTVK